jgi:hypothetical protein
MSTPQQPTIAPSAPRWWRDSFQLMMKAPMRWYFIGLLAVLVILTALTPVLSMLLSTNDFGVLGILVCIAMAFVLFIFFSLTAGIASAGNSQVCGEKPGFACLLKGFKLTTAGFALMITVIALAILFAVLFAAF